LIFKASLLGGAFCFEVKFGLFYFAVVCGMI